MDMNEPRSSYDHQSRLLDENEQLRTALESSLEENARLLEDRDRLLMRVTTLARELQAANTAYSRSLLTEPALAMARDEREQARQSQSDEELRVAFEELQVLTEELEVANTGLHEANALLEGRVEERTRELAESNAELQKSETAFRTLVEGMPQLAWRSRHGGEWTWSSPQWSAYTGQSPEESMGRGWLLALHPDDRSAAEQAWSSLAEQQALEFETRIFHAIERRYRHFRILAAPAQAADGTVVEWLGTSTDVHDIIQLQQRQDVLVDELQHRTRNLMAVVQAVLMRTLKGSKSLEEFRRCIDDRLRALARAQSLLSRRGLGKVMFEALIHEELSAHLELDSMGNGQRLSMSGPANVPLQSSSVQTLALALHELATNATKYGALASGSGHLDIRWEVLTETDSAHWLHIEWIESGVEGILDPQTVPQARGYGRELIERALPYQLGARTSYALTPDGVHCTIDVNILADEIEAEASHD